MSITSTIIRIFYLISTKEESDSISLQSYRPLSQT